MNSGHPEMIHLDQHVGRYATWKDIPTDVKEAYLLNQCRKNETASIKSKRVNAFISPTGRKLFQPSVHKLYTRLSIL